MAELFDLLKSIGLPIASIIGAAIAAFLAREAWAMLKSRRLAASETIVSRRLAALDEQLEKFYLPLRERLAVTKKLFETAKGWEGSNGYRNGDLVESDHPEGLRNIVVRRILLPLNAEIEKLILNNSRFRDACDRTDYSLLAQHYVLWRAFEQAIIDGEIQGYHGAGLMEFPAEEAKSLVATCEMLLSRRDNIQRRLLQLRDAEEHLFPRPPSPTFEKGDALMSRARMRAPTTKKEERSTASSVVSLVDGNPPTPRNEAPTCADLTHDDDCDYNYDSGRVKNHA